MLCVGKLKDVVKDVVKDSVKDGVKHLDKIRFDKLSQIIWLNIMKNTVIELK